MGEAAVTWSDVGEKSRAPGGASTPVSPARDRRAAGGAVPVRRWSGGRARRPRPTSAGCRNGWPRWRHFGPAEAGGGCRQRRGGARGGGRAPSWPGPGMGSAYPMTLAVRSEALAAAAAPVEELADEIRDGAHGSRLRWRARVQSGCRSPRRPGAGVAVGAGRARRPPAVVGPGGAWGEALALDVLAVRLRAAARVYAGVEASVSAVLAGVGAGADLAARGGWLTDGTSMPTVTAVPPTLVLDRDHGFRHAADLVAAGEGLDGGRVRVVEVVRGDGGSAWVVVVPAPRRGRRTPARTRSTSPPTCGRHRRHHGRGGRRGRCPRAGPVPGRLAVDRRETRSCSSATARAASSRRRSRATRASRRRHRVSHVVTSGSPIGLFPVPATTRVLARRAR